MDDRADDRLRGGLLAAATLLAVAVGGGWWWANSPATGPHGVALGASAAPRGVVPSRSPQTLDEVLAANPGTAVRVHIDAETGRVIEATELPGEAGDLALPGFTDTLWREHMTLAPGEEPVRRESLVDGARQLLQYRCTGPGELLISIIRGPNMDTSQTNCDGELGELELPEWMEPGDAPPEQPLLNRVEFSAVGPRPVQVEAQLVAVP
ncbi:hypothetical protein GA0074696_0963 [Micromonospora purpureochromogenes]|uniref:Uncharacterized protein n=1 Tax=Micromonospora purpureochromogenes TaxID=47872 RepID=A0A1C4V8W1_9ACTN|nr:hypothetical protein [Micromonospora purpureochromogenes]SCE80473.1 hypothetical protein GA0074696_0963 [Micromonospora purpureochromogenes]